MLERMTSYIQGLVGNQENTLTEGAVEKKEKLPQLNIEILYGHHRSEDDFSRFADKILAADVYCPEGVFGANYLYLLQEVSDGKVTPSEMRNRIAGLNFNGSEGFVREMETTLYKSKRLIVPLDISSDDKQSAVAERIVKQAGVFSQQLAAGYSQWGGRRLSFNDAVNDIVKLSEQTANILMDYREEKMLKNAKEKIIQQVKSRRKNLLKKDQLKVVLTLGASHTGLFLNMKKDGLSVERDFPAGFFTFGYRGAVDRSTRFGKSISLKMVAKALVETLLDHNNAIDKLFKSVSETNKAFQVCTKIADQFTLDDIRDLFVGPETPLDKLDKQLQAKNIRPPSNETEADNFLEK